MSLDINQFVTLNDDGMRFTQAQANEFAKDVAGDFNPIHDIGAKRFCVPGDLLFTVLLHRYGLFENITLELNAMLSADVQVPLPSALSGNDDILDASDRHLLTLATAGDVTQDKQLVNSVAEEYVRFSGKTFPDILVELMRNEGVMINPGRPLVIYKSMSLHMDDLSADSVKLELKDTSMEVEGKKANALLRFSISASGKVVGHGEKHMILSGLREYDETVMQSVVEQYAEWKTQYQKEMVKS